MRPLGKITKLFDGQEVDRSKLYLGEGVKPLQIKSRPRIGITCTDDWKDLPLCFFVYGDRHVSKVSKVGLLDDNETWID